MTPASPEQARGQLTKALADLDSSISDLKVALAEVRAEQAEADKRPPDRAMVDMLREASRSMEAPVSLRRLAAKVDRGTMTWAQVISGSDDPDIRAFRVAALATAREHFDDLDPGVDGKVNPDVPK